MMKTITLTISLVLFFGVIMLSAFGQTPPKTNPTPTAAADTAKTSSSSGSSDPNTPKTAKPTDSTGMGQYKGKSFVFQQNVRILECNAVGGNADHPTSPIAPQGITFTVKSVTSTGDLVISFWIWGLKKSRQAEPITSENIVSIKGKMDRLGDGKAERDSADQIDRIIKRETFNFKNFAYKSYAPLSIDSVNDNVRYFLLKKSDLTKYCVEYQDVKKWEINFGTLVTPFKLRFNRFSFSNDLSVGGAVYYQHKFDADWSWGGVFALSLSSVTLDAASTNIHQNATNTNPPLTSSTDRPAFSPSIHYVMGYKNINFTIGIGFDYLSKPTDVATAQNPEAGWIYNGKPWIGIGLGLSLFNNSSTKATPNTPGQTPGQ